MPKTVENQEPEIYLCRIGLVFICCPYLELSCWAIYAQYLIYNHRLCITSLHTKKGDLQ
jgi:hypothetical protein